MDLDLNNDLDSRSSVIAWLQGAFEDGGLAPNQELLERISSDVIHLSTTEPYGIRGCELQLVYADQLSSAQQNEVKRPFDRYVVSTFKLELHIRHSQRPSFLSLLRGLLRRVRTRKSRPLHKVCYVLKKIKLHRQNCAPEIVSRKRGGYVTRT